MLDIFGEGSRTGDGVSRRGILRVGALGLGGLTLADMLRIRERASASDSGRRRAETSVIQVFLGGGPSHIDTYDPKPDAPAEFRGEFRPIATTVPGVALCELFPRQARIMDRLAIVRGLHHTSADHGAGAHWVMTGFASTEPNPRGNDRPSVGAIAARVRGAAGRACRRMSPSPTRRRSARRRTSGPDSTRSRSRETCSAGRRSATSTHPRA